MKYRTIVADPPWPFRFSGGTGGRRRNRTSLGYDLMALDDIKALPVADFVVAFGGTRGTMDMVGRARRAGVTVYRIENDSAPFEETS